MAPVPESVARQAELLRISGNAAFKKERLGAAIDAYTEAIALCPDVAVYWTNRALCHLRRKEWNRVEEDCRQALKLDNNSVKAHYMLGQALLERHDYADGIRELEKALDLERGVDPLNCKVEEMWQVLSKAKYMEWEELSSKQSWKLQSLKEACEKALLEHYFLKDSGEANEPKKSGDEPSEQLELLAEVFKKAAEADMPTEVPDYLCCKITLDIFRDPVIAPSGVTYERVAILDHLRKVGNFDPITREPLKQHQLAPNLAIKQAVQAFLRNHGWAYKVN